MKSIAITPGEPAGIGPELVLSVARRFPDIPLLVVADPDLMARAARRAGTDLSIHSVDDGALPDPEPGRLHVLPVLLGREETPGKLDPDNAAYVVETLARATDLCRDGRAEALVTAPVHKGVINDAGIAFSGHTEFLAHRCGARTPVMMLAAGDLRVALLTTHLPLRQVPDAVTGEAITRTLHILHGALQRDFGIDDPRIAVLGLNPHAGEGGHLGREEIEVIEPALSALRAEGLDLAGPLPADTAFTPAKLADFDAVLALYHDQGLPVLKHAGFGRAVNITLGLPIVRTSVDHGTALDLAGTGRADAGSLAAALETALDMARRRAGA